MFSTDPDCNLGRSFALGGVTQLSRRGDLRSGAPGGLATGRSGARRVQLTARVGDQAELDGPLYRSQRPRLAVAEPKLILQLAEGKLNGETGGVQTHYLNGGQSKIGTKQERRAAQPALWSYAEGVITRYGDDPPRGAIHFG